MIKQDEFNKYAVKHKGINSLTLGQYTKQITNMTRSVIEEREMPFREVDVFSRLMLERIIFIGTAIDETVANIIQAQLLFLDSVDPSKDIQIYFNTPGGTIYGGMGIYDTMQFINPDIACTCTGLAASMGAVLLSAGTKGKRFALKHSRIMLHQPYGYTGGQASDIEIDVEHLQEMQKDLYSVIALHTGQDIDKIQKDVDRDFWMSSKAAVEYGIIDQVIERNKNK
ncbi:MAG: ATP-dependent Clp protease proteolytic subunit [Bacteroidales bacterium]|nr:ATP-dependent Clp protease proteolytic subunit [Bacteroidales bacterium]